MMESVQAFRALTISRHEDFIPPVNFSCPLADSVHFFSPSTNVVYKDSYLMAGAQRRRKNSSQEDVPNSAPAKWPGVASLRALLAREKDEDLPRLPILLAEALVAVYMSLLAHALATYDANILYRLVAHTFKDGLWHVLFGGGVRKLIPVSTQPDAALRKCPNFLFLCPVWAGALSDLDPLSTKLLDRMM